MQLHFYFNDKLFIGTSSWDLMSRISVLQIFQKMDKRGMALPQRACNLDFRKDATGARISQSWHGEKGEKYPKEAYQQKYDFYAMLQPAQRRVVAEVV